MVLRVTAVVVALSLACQPGQPREDRPTRAASTGGESASNQLREFNVDSVVLERTSCDGACLAYRVAITRENVVHFESRTPRDSGRVGLDTLRGRQGFGTVLGHVVMARFLALPDSIKVDEPFCRPQQRVGPYAIVTVYYAGRSKRVVDYVECPWAPSALRELEVAVDSVTRVERWLEPA